jgi:hypothetical protein
MDNQNDIYITKPLTFKYTFRIDKEKYEFYQIRRDLSRSLVEHSENYRRFREFQKEEYYQGATYFVLNDLFQKRFLFSGNTNAYLTDYSENKGSLIITFTILIVGAVTNYGSIRETIDYFAEDVERLFSNSLDSWTTGYTVTSSIQEQNNHNFYSQTQPRLVDTNQYNSLLAKIKVDRILIGIVFFVLILSLLQNYLATSDNTKQTDTDETRLKTIIRDEIRNQKIDELLKAKIDTVYVPKK